MSNQRVAYVHGASSHPLIGETIGSTFRRTVERFPDSDALVCCEQNKRFTYAELSAAVEQAALGLLALGIEPGDRVGIWAPNRAEWTILQFATARIGAILVNINPAYRAHELEYVLNQAGVTTLAYSARVRDRDFREILLSVDQNVPELKNRIVIGGDPQSGQLSWEDLLDRSSASLVPALQFTESLLQFDDAINIQYTSGTTGFPKGATLTHHNILNNGFFTGEGCRYTDRDRVCIPVPLYHCFGMVLGNLACIAHGAAMVYPSEGFDACATLRAVESERCTSLYGVPTMFIAELEHADFSTFDLSSLRTGIMAGSPCPIEVMKRVQTEMHMSEVTICYGMTETSPVSFQSSIEDPVEMRVSTVGRIHPHVEAKVINPESGRILACGQPGELCSRGYPVMLGYWNNDEATRQAIDAGGWMHTGDLATIDESGYCRIVGRIKDMVIRGGENIYPREVEEFLYTHPSIGDVQVIGVPDLKYGEELCAWVRLKEGAIEDGESLRAWCSGKIATYKIPRYWKLTDSFPMTVTGKIQKFKMREQSIDELGLAEAAQTRTA